MQRAEQMVYGRVTPEYSPDGVGGYCAVHASSGLSRSDVDFLTRRVRGLSEFAEIGSVRLQFFIVTPNRYGVARSEKVRADKQISDSRPHSILAHALVLSQEAFSELQCNPFAILDQPGWYVSNHRSMVERFGVRRAVVDACDLVSEVEIEREPKPDWNAGEWAKLIQLALAAEEIVAKGHTLLFLGESSNVVRVLRALFDVLPHSARRHCSFDTSANIAEFRPGDFWAIRSEIRPHTGRFIEVNVTDGMVNFPSSALSERRGLYARWIANASEDEIEALGPTFCRLAECYESGQLHSIADLDTTACAEFYRVFGSLVRSDLEGRLRRWLPRRTARRLSPLILEGLSHGIRPWWLCEEEWMAGLSEWLTYWISVEQPVLSFFELRRMSVLSRFLGCRPLQFWAQMLHWFPRGDNAFKLLGQMSDTEFKTSLALLGRPIRAEKYVHPAHMTALVSALVDAPLGEACLLRVISEILKAGGADALAPLSSRVRWLSVRGVRCIALQVVQLQAEESEFGKTVLQHASGHVLLSASV